MINLSPEIKSIQSLYREFTEYRLIVNRKYQRKLVWTLEEKQKLIESILNSFPIPNVLLAKTNESNELEIIDGMQRLHTIMSFIEQGFNYNGKYFNLESFPTAKAQAEKGEFIPKAGNNVEYLDSDECNKILDYSLSTLIIRNVNDEVINDVFSRINTYGHRLSNQERRQAGVQTNFSNIVRKISTIIRGDCSTDILPLKKMPQISIDLPRSKSGYGVLAEETFWIRQGILRASDLRDSLDEQCVADIVATIVDGYKPLARDKDVLDSLYQPGSAESERISNSIGEYGLEKIEQEFLFCIKILDELCKQEKLRNMIYGTKLSSNPIPSIFSQVFIAIHEIIFKEGNDISDYILLQSKLESLKDKNLSDARTVEKRENNINMIKGVIRDAFKNKLNIGDVYKHIDAVKVDNIISRDLEQPTLEFKQGCLSLSNARNIDNNLFDKIINTICAIANTTQEGVIIIGVADNDADANRIAQLDNIVPRTVHRRKVVGIDREARQLELAPESYLSLWKDKIVNSELSEPLKTDVLSHCSYIPYYGYGIILIYVPEQKSLSFVGNSVYWRKIDNTTAVDGIADPRKIAELASKFR